MENLINTNGKFSLAVVAQALIVAVITATATGYVSARVLESKVDYLIQEIIRVDQHGKETRAKVDEIAIRQARVIGQADSTHEAQNKRIDKLESRR